MIERGEKMQKKSGGSFLVAKTEPDKMLVFGWANAATRKDGAQVEDLQGDVIDPDELEKAAYDHVLRFRSTGERHDPRLRSKGRLIESCVFTKEKQAAMGIPPGVLGEAWWVGYKIDDPDAWAKIKSGEYKMFSVEGKGKREAIAKSYAEAKEALERQGAASEEKLQSSAKKIVFLKRDGGIIEFEKFNPYHDQLGRFSTGNAFVTFSPGNNPAQAKRSIDRENERRKKEGVEGEVGGKFVNVGAAGGKDKYHPMPYNEAKRLAAEHARQAERKEPPKSSFKPAKTAKEATKYARETLGIEKTDFGKLHIDVCNQINQSLTEHFNQFPELKKNFDFVGSAQARNRLVSAEIKRMYLAETIKYYKKAHPDWDDERARNQAERRWEADKKQFKINRVPGNTYAQSVSGGILTGITINEKFGKNPAAMNQALERDVKSGWHPQGAGSIKAVVDHEIGHQIDNLVGARNAPSIQSAYGSRTKGQIQSELSEYGNKNIREFIAESWAEYKNNPQCRPLAKQIGGEMERLYNEKRRS